MYRRICALSNRTKPAAPAAHCNDVAQRRSIFFFFVLAVIPFFFRAPAASASDGTPASSPPGLASASAGQAPQDPAANFPLFTKVTTPVVLSISVNTEPKGDFFVEMDDQSGLFLTVEDLVALKLKFDHDRIVLIHGQKYAPMSSVQDIQYTFDEKNLTVAILGKTTEVKKTAIELFQLQARPQNVYYPRETSAFLNYGLTYSYADPYGFQSFTASNKIGARTGDVFFTSDSLYTKTETNQQFVRLQSSATYERRNDLQWLVLGDQFASSGDLGSSVNIGGIGFSKLFKLDPYLITQPVFNLQGVTQFPSQAEIYMDGMLIGKQSIAPGSFDLENIYSYSGGHTVEVVLTDPFGNERRISYPLYVSTQLLREGLHEYSYNAGFLRENYGVQSGDYGKAAFSAFHRYGVTSSFNIGARAEGSDGVYNGGVFTAFAMPRLGAVTLSVAGSSANGAQGYAGSLQHTYQFKSFSTNLSLREYSRDYATVSAQPSPDMTRYSASAGVGFLLPVGGISLGYSETETYSGMNTRVTSANYSRGLTKAMSLFATASATRTVDTIYSVFVGLNFNFARDLHGSAQISQTGSTNTETVQLQKDNPVGEGLGYRAALNRSSTSAGDTYGFNPFVQYNGRYGIYTFDSTMQNAYGAASETYNVSAAGSLVYAGGFYGLSRPVNDSFSIVTVDKVPGAVVLDNGQVIGKTNSSGTLVVPTLTSYGQNQITLDVKNMPMDYSISGVNKALSPPVWSGSCVAFDAERVRALTGTLYAQTAGKKTPLEYVDITMKVGTRDITFPTGKGGEFYMENSLPEDAKSGAVDRQSCRSIAERRKAGGNVIRPGTYPASVEFEGGKCTFSITFPDTEDVITDIGEVQCMKK